MPTSSKHGVIARVVISIQMAFVSLWAVTLLLGCRSASNQIKPLDSDHKADKIVVSKTNHTMTLMSKGEALRVYKVALGRGSNGPKEHQGDHKTPEGEYLIDQKNQQSRFHLALHVSYPTATDRKRAQ